MFGNSYSMCFRWFYRLIYLCGCVNKTKMCFLHSRLFYKWTTGDNSPPSGTLMQLVTADGKTEATPVL